MIRTRFAPSPNGLLHLGHAYAAVVAHDLARARGNRPATLERIVVAVDPPASAGGDACGIVVVGRRDGRAYVLADGGHAYPNVHGAEFRRVMTAFLLES